MKKSIYVLFAIFLFYSANANAQQFGCTNESFCNLICNPLLEEYGPGECGDDLTIINDDAFECVPGWRMLYGSIDHAEPDAVGNQNFDFSGHPGNDHGSLMIAGSNSTTTFITEGVGASFTMNPNTDYLMTFSVADAIIAEPIWDHLRPAEGINVLLGNYDILNTSAVGSPTLFFNYGTNSYSGALGGPEFREDAQSVYQNENIDISWSQKVACFSTGNHNYDLLFFEYLKPFEPVDIGEEVYYIKIDQIEVIEDLFINNAAGIQTSHQAECGTNVNVGAELCTVTGMHYEIWDVTDPLNDFQLTNSTNTNAYSVSSINGSMANLSNVIENVNLQIRRVFEAQNGVPVENDNCGETLDISITVNCCDADPWPKIYEGPNFIAPTNQGLEVDGFGNVYVLRANNQTGTSMTFSSMDLLKYCEDGELQWSVTLQQSLLSGYRPNTRLAVDNSGHAYVISMYQNSMVAGGVNISNPGQNLVILKFDPNGVLLANRSIPYSNSSVSKDYESIKVSADGGRLYVLLNDRIKWINSNTLSDIYNRFGTYHSIDINKDGTNIFYLSNSTIGAFVGGLFNNPVTTSLVGIPKSKTDFEYDESTKRIYVVVSDHRLFVYRFNSNAISLQLTIPQSIKSSFYTEVVPVGGGVLVYNPLASGTVGYTGPEGVTFYDLGGGISWNLPINGFTTMRTPNMWNVKGKYAYLGANWAKSLNMGWYSGLGTSGSFVARIDLTTGTFSFNEPPPAYKAEPGNQYLTSQANDDLQDTLNPVLSVFPNPAANEITIDYPNLPNSNYQLVIYNTSGQLIFDESGDQWMGSKRVFLNENNGLYMVRLRIKEKVMVEKFLVNRQ